MISINTRYHKVVYFVFYYLKVEKQLQNRTNTLHSSFSQKNNEAMNTFKGAIANMLKKGKGNKESFTVECGRISKERDGNIKINIYDAQQSCKAMIEAQKAKKSFDRFLRSKEIFQLTIYSFTVYNNQTKAGFQTIISIEEFKIVQPNKIKKQYNPPLLKFQESSQTAKKDHKKQQQIISYLKMESFQNIPPEITECKPKLMLDSLSDQNEETKPEVKEDININTFQKIEDLYEGLFGWQLLVRVIDKSFREFISKQNKQIQILTIEFIDRAGFMIQATCFGQQAVFLNATIKTGGVYRIARGKISEQTFKKQKSHKHSKYTIKLQRDSSIIPVRDFPQIPNNSNNYVRLSQVTYDIDTTQFYNFVGILIKIEPEKIIPKQDRQIVMQTFQIGDPITDVTIEGIIWNRQVSLDKNLLNRSVLLKNFKVCNYKNTLNLSGTFKSDIVVHDLFIDKQNVWKSSKTVQEQTQKIIKKLSDLHRDLKHLERQTIISNINVWVKAIPFGSKWYYDSCPKCKKASTPSNICINCLYRVTQCTKRFLLSVQLCDDTGSIFVTSFDDTASIFLKNVTMQELQDMNDSQRKQFADKCTFQCYEMKISSKKDANGRINHNIIGKPEILDPKLKAQMNLKKIMKQIQQINPLNNLH